MLRSVSSSSLPRGFATIVRQRGCSVIANSLSQQQVQFRNFHSQQDVSNDATTQQQQTMSIAHHLHHNNPHLLGSLNVRHPSTPFVLGWGDVECEMEDPRYANHSNLFGEEEMTVMEEAETAEEPTEENPTESLLMGGRNTRKVKKANHGKRPCNRLGRRAKRRRYGNPRVLR